MARDPNPQWRTARVVENRVVARGSMWLTLEADDGQPAAFEPGHVLGLGIEQSNGEYLRHAYTVTRGDPRRRRFSHVYRVIPDGCLTPRLEKMQPGEFICFHGPGHTPIQKEVQPQARRIAGWATGTGIGPLYGYAEKALAEGEQRIITLFVGMREESDICLRDELESLRTRYSNFSCHFTLTRPGPSWKGLRGRLTDAVPPLLGCLKDLHVHLVGNGEMVHLVRPALYEAGMPKGRVSVETYFNHHAKPAADAINALAREDTQLPWPGSAPVTFTPFEIPVKLPPPW